jgi:hypothetical protein
MSSLSHVHVEVAIKDAFAAARRQIETLAQRAAARSSSIFENRKTVDEP